VPEPNIVENEGAKSSLGNNISNYGLKAHAEVDEDIYSPGTKIDNEQLSQGFIWIGYYLTNS
jgi:hypothetical protein